MNCTKSGAPIGSLSLKAEVAMFSPTAPLLESGSPMHLFAYACALEANPSSHVKVSMSEAVQGKDTAARSALCFPTMAAWCSWSRAVVREESEVSLRRWHVAGVQGPFSVVDVVVEVDLGRHKHTVVVVDVLVVVVVVFVVVVAVVVVVIDVLVVEVLVVDVVVELVEVFVVVVVGSHEEGSVGLTPSSQRPGRVQLEAAQAAQHWPQAKGRRIPTSFATAFPIGLYLQTMTMPAAYSNPLMLIPDRQAVAAQPILFELAQRSCVK